VNAFSQLSESSLLALLEAIEKQGLTSGNRLLLARHLHSTEVETVGTEIDRLIGEGLSQSHFKQLATRMTAEPQLEVKMFLNIARALRDTTIPEQLIGRFANEFRREHWSGTRYPVIFYDPRALAIDEKKRTSLHAKCVVVDGARSLVTSANFTEAAQQRNIEVGVLVTDERFSKALVTQFDTLIRAGAVEPLPLS